jgi:hypothetical protein
MHNNKSGPEPELPLPSTHDVNLLDVTHGMQPTVEPERDASKIKFETCTGGAASIVYPEPDCVPTMDGDEVRQDGETADEFSLRVAIQRREQLEQRKNAGDRANEAVHPLQKFARVWGAG